MKAKTKTLNADVKAAKPTMHESMLYTNLSGCLVAGVLAAFAGHLTDGVAFCLKYPEVCATAYLRTPRPAARTASCG